MAVMPILNDFKLKKKYNLTVNKAINPLRHKWLLSVKDSGKNINERGQ